MLSMMALVAAVVAAVILIFFGIGYLFGSLFLYARDASVSRRERIALTTLCLVGSGLFFLFPVAAFPPDIRYTEAFALLVYALVPFVAWKARPRAA